MEAPVQPYAAGRRPGVRQGPLAGIRVADFCWMGVGSVATRLLADFGAEVIKIENRKRLDMPRRLPIFKDDPLTFGAEESVPDPNKGGLFNNYCRNKLGVTIDMSDPQGHEIAERLITASSVVTENFAPGVMERWGLTYDSLRALRSDVIFARMSGYGHTGPHAEYRSYGPVVQAVSGLSFISGMPGQEPSGWGLSYMDNQAAYYNSAALLVAIMRRNETGEGTEIDVSAVEVGINLLGPEMLDVTANGNAKRTEDFPTGNRLPHSDATPHGVYPCAGEDAWIAIAVFSDEEWQNLCRAADQSPWWAKEEWRTVAGRVAARDAIDQEIASWTATYDKHDLMRLLQEGGVRAGAVQNAQDVNEKDPQVAARGVFFELDHPVIGPARFEGVPVKMSRTQADNWRSAPLLGEDNEYVFGAVLGMDAERIADLLAQGVI